MIFQMIVARIESIYTRFKVTWILLYQLRRYNDIRIITVNV